MGILVENGTFYKIGKSNENVIFEVNLEPYHWDWQAVIPNENKMNDQILKSSKKSYYDITVYFKC